MTDLHLTDTEFEARLPMSQEVFVGCNTEAAHDKRVRDLPIARLAHHVLGFRIYQFNSFCPFWMIDFRLSRL